MFGWAIWTHCTLRQRSLSNIKRHRTYGRHPEQGLPPTQRRAPKAATRLRERDIFPHSRIPGDINTHPTSLFPYHPSSATLRERALLDYLEGEVTVVAHDFGAPILTIFSHRWVSDHALCGLSAASCMKLSRSGDSERSEKHILRVM